MFSKSKKKKHSSKKSDISISSFVILSIAVKPHTTIITTSKKEVSGIFLGDNLMKVENI